MTMTSVAKFSAIYMLIVMMVGVGAALWPSSSDRLASRGDSAPRFILN